MPAPRKSTPRKTTARKKSSTKKKTVSDSGRGKKKTPRGVKKTGTSARRTGKGTAAKGTAAKSRPAGRRKTPRRPTTTRSAPDGPQRLQKVLAAAGVASRRECEQLVLEGRVEVDREVITKLGTKVDPELQKIRVDGTLLKTTRRVYFVVNKPQGVVSTSRDPSGRPRVIDMIPETSGRVFTVGRLDMASEGLILLTNDGELANQLTHPRYGVEKTYEVQVAGMAEVGLVKDLCRGIHLAEDFVSADQARIKRRHKKSTVLEIVLSEGKNREIRRMLARLGHKVQRLRRVAIGPLKMGELPEGHVRQLEPAEVKRLRAAVSATPTSGRPQAKGTTTRVTTTGQVTTTGSKTKKSVRGGKKTTGRVKKGTARPNKKAAKPMPILKSPNES